LGRETVLVCTLRDNDGKNPYQLLWVNFADGTSKKVSSIFSSDLDDCVNSLDAARTQANGGIVSCTSRDADDRAPFIKVLIGENGSVTRGSETYTTIEVCQASLSFY